MEHKESTSGMLDLMIQPAFTVQDGVIVKVNIGAKAYHLEPGQQISSLLMTGQEEYKDLTDGCLYLSLRISGLPCGASVRRMDGFDIFTIEQETEQVELQAMALAAKELREPLSNVMAVVDQMFPVTDESENAEMKAQTARINRGLFQMLRIIGNMSDAYRYSQQAEPRLSLINISGVLEEIFLKSAELIHHGGAKLQYYGLAQPVYGLADPEKLERAIHNIISNAVKFSGNSSKIEARLTRRNNTLYLSVWDDGNGIPADMRGTVYSRYRRQPGMEDNRFGIGLGMVLIRSTATAHGGTVLIDHPSEGGVRLTMTLAIKQNLDSAVRASIMQVDYAGERDHSLIELSDVLPSSLYETKKIN